MQNIKQRIENYVGETLTDEMVTAFMHAGFRAVIMVTPDEKLMKHAHWVPISNLDGEDIDQIKVIGVNSSTGIGAKFVPVEKINAIANTSSLYEAHEYSPVWTVKENTLIVRPKKDSKNANLTYSLFGVVFPQFIPTVTVINEYPEDFAQIIVLYSAIQGKYYLLSKRNTDLLNVAMKIAYPPQLPTDVTLGSLPTPPIYINSGIDIPTFDGSLIPAPQLDVNDPDYTWTTIVENLDVAINFSSITFPTAPTFTGIDAITIPTIGTLPTVPSFAIEPPPQLNFVLPNDVSVSIPNVQGMLQTSYNNLENEQDIEQAKQEIDNILAFLQGAKLEVEVAVANLQKYNVMSQVQIAQMEAYVQRMKAIEMQIAVYKTQLDAVIATFQAQMQGYNTQVQALLSNAIQKYNAGKDEYEAKLKKYFEEIEELIKFEMDNTAITNDFTKTNAIKSLETQFQLFKDQIAKSQLSMENYSMQIKNQLDLYNHRLQIYNTKSQIAIADNTNRYNAEKERFEAELNLVLKQADISLQSKIENYRTQVNSYQMEVQQNIADYQYTILKYQNVIDNDLKSLESLKQEYDKTLQSYLGDKGNG